MAQAFVLARARRSQHYATTTFHHIRPVKCRWGPGAIGIGYLLAPHWVYGLYGIGIDSVNEANMVRAAYGGLFVASALLFVLGATYDGLTRPALIYLLVFMLGLACGRTISVLVDGVPSGSIVLVQGGEVMYIALAALALYMQRSRER